jgi:hypothetical protein
MTSAPRENAAETIFAMAKAMELSVFLLFFSPSCPSEEEVPKINRTDGPLPTSGCIVRKA